MFSNSFHFKKLLFSVLLISFQVGDYVMLNQNGEKLVIGRIEELMVSYLHEFFSPISNHITHLPIFCFLSLKTPFVSQSYKKIV